MNLEPPSLQLMPVHSSYRYLKSFQVDAGVTVIAIEIKRRRTEARRLRSSTGAEWIRAPARFDQELLG
jgi:hypothetical protein